MSEQNFIPRLPYFFVGKAMTSKRVKHFMDTKAPILDAALGRTDTRTVWYSFDHIERLYHELVYLKANGLRVYLGAYDETHPQTPDQTCLLLVPTRLNENGKNQDVMVEDEPGFTERDGVVIFMDDETEKNYNIGGLCPPACINEVLGFPQ